MSILKNIVYLFKLSREQLVLKAASFAMAASCLLQPIQTLDKAQSTDDGPGRLVLTIDIPDVNDHIHILEQLAPDIQFSQEEKGYSK